MLRSIVPINASSSLRLALCFGCIDLLYGLRQMKVMLLIFCRYLRTWGSTVRSAAQYDEGYSYINCLLSMHLLLCREPCGI